MPARRVGSVRIGGGQRRDEDPAPATRQKSAGASRVRRLGDGTDARAARRPATARLGAAAAARTRAPDTRDGSAAVPPRSRDRGPHVDRRAVGSGTTGYTGTAHSTWNDSSGARAHFGARCDGALQRVGRGVPHDHCPAGSALRRAAPIRADAGTTGRGAPSAQVPTQPAFPLQFAQQRPGADSGRSSGCPEGVTQLARTLRYMPGAKSS